MIKIENIRKYYKILLPSTKLTFLLPSGHAGNHLPFFSIFYNCTMVFCLKRRINDSNIAWWFVQKPGGRGWKTLSKIIEQLCLMEGWITKNILAQSVITPLYLLMCIIKMKVILLISITIIFVASFHFQPSLKARQGVKATYTTFKVNYPQANLPANSQIYLRGDNCNLTWTKGVPIKKVGIDNWATAMLCPTDIKISIKLLVNDTKWMMGANHQFIVSAASPDSSTVTVYPSFNPSVNKIVDTAAVHSSILGNSRKLSIYYPPSYFDNKYKKYELLLMHDGQNLFDPSKAAFGVAWMIQNTANLLVGQGRINQTIIVGIWNTNDRINQYTYSYDPTQKFGGKGDLYLDFIQKELLPKLKTDYFAGRLEEGGVGIGGSSLGGLISCYALYTRPQIYKKAICMSSSFWWNSQDFKKIVSTTRTYNPSSTFYLDSGDSGPSQDGKAQTENVKASLIQKGYVENKNLFYYLDKGGQHSQSYWGKRFPIPMQYLYNAEL